MEVKEVLYNFCFLILRWMDMDEVIGKLMDEYFCYLMLCGKGDYEWLLSFLVCIFVVYVW